MSRIKDMTTGSITKHILTFAFPLIFTLISEPKNEGRIFSVLPSACYIQVTQGIVSRTLHLLYDNSKFVTQALGLCAVACFQAAGDSGLVVFL